MEVIYQYVTNMSASCICSEPRIVFGLQSFNTAKQTGKQQLFTVCAFIVFVLEMSTCCFHRCPS